MKIVGTSNISCMRLHDEYLFHSSCFFLRLEGMTIWKAFPEVNTIDAFKGVYLNQIKQIYNQNILLINQYLIYDKHEQLK